jgi:hypothetical protein
MNAKFKEKSLDSSEEYFTKLKDINITTVDSFQASRMFDSADESGRGPRQI